MRAYLEGWMCSVNEVLNTPPGELESADNSRALCNSRLHR